MFYYTSHLGSYLTMQEVLHDLNEGLLGPFSFQLCISSQPKLSGVLKSLPLSML